MSYAEVCDSIASVGRGGLFIFYVTPFPELKWDMQPRTFHVGVCNSLPVSTVPESDFVLSIHLTDKPVILGQTPHLAIQLKPGFHDLTLAPWIPGLENHKTICVQRSVLALEVGYSDQPGSKNYHAVHWLDGSPSHKYPIKCGGDYS